MRAGLFSISRVLGLGACFSGAALVVHIISGFSLRLALLLTGSLLVIAVVTQWRRASTKERVRLMRLTKVGALSGAMALIAYDVSKFLLSQLDPSPFNPFDAIRFFGILLAGSSVTQPAVYAAGISFHILNGICFGMAFCFLFGRRGVVAGIAWGLFLELFQLSLFPGWLDIRFYSEFALISSVSHVVYGAVLGFSCRYGLRERPAGLP